MRYIVILMTVVLYWFLLSIGMGLLVQDELIFAAATEGNISSVSVNTSDLNFSSISQTQEGTSMDKFKASTSFLFGMKSPILSDTPLLLRAIIGFINWFILIITILSIYKLINPLSSG